MSQPVFQSLWIGERLGPMELLSIESFLHFGYEFHLYAYDEIDNVPEGAQLLDARRFLPDDQVQEIKSGFGKSAMAACSDVFRYQMLIENGGWWVDTDVVCIAEWNFADDHVLGQQRQDDGLGVNGAILRAPAGSPLLERCIQEFEQTDPRTAQWHSTGPALLNRVVHDMGLEACLQEPNVFYPIDFWRIEQFFEEYEPAPNTAGIHLWNAMWRKRRIDPGAPMPPNCLYEQLRRCFIRGYEPPELTEFELRRIEKDLALANAPRPKDLIGRIGYTLRRQWQALRQAS